MKKIATIILNRNLPDVTDQLYEKFERINNDITDLFVVESGSSKEKLSQYCTWWANWESALTHGLRYARGFNYAISQFIKEGLFEKYDYYFFVCNDVEFDKDILSPLYGELSAHPKVGIISPCSDNWGELKLLGKDKTKYVWHVNHLAWLVKREFIETIVDITDIDYMNGLYDGTNFRGYFSDIELVVKGYVNEWATALTTKAIIHEQLDSLKNKASLMDTDPYEENLKRVFAEGSVWMKQKYGFNSKWQMQKYAEVFYNYFFNLNPSLKQWKL